MRRKFLPWSILAVILAGGVFVAISREKGRGERVEPVAAGKGAVPVVSAEPGAGSSTGAQNESNVARDDSRQAVVPVAKRNPALPVSQEFVRGLATGPEQVGFPLPGGSALSGVVERRVTDDLGNPVGVEGRVTAPAKGRFIFSVEPAGGVQGEVTGWVYFDEGPSGYRVLPVEGHSELTLLPVDQVVCRMQEASPEFLAEEAVPDVEEIPADHPEDIAIPDYQNGIIPLQSRPGAVAVVYLDFDGEKGPQPGWGEFDAAAPSVTKAQVKEVWARVAEDYAPFNINITTDLQVYLAAPATSRQRCILTPTKTAAPTAGGVALVGSFNSSNNSPCWAFYSTGKSAAEVVSHEVGHTLGLSHDGRTTPAESYYTGHGTDPVGWAPIMGAGYYKNLTQWSKGEYAAANQTQDDLAIISGNNNNVSYRLDDAGDSHATAVPLEIYSGGTLNSEGLIGNRTDVDAFRFTTTGGAVNVTVSPVDKGPDLDVEASIYDASGNRLLVSNPDTAVKATLATTLAAGEYTIRVDGVGRGDPLGTGYTDYASLGQYTITGTIGGALAPTRLSVAENPAAGQVVGTPALRDEHAADALTRSIASGNEAGAFLIDATTGELSVASPGVINFEALSPGWTQPARFDLTVIASDPSDSSLTETLRVVVNVTDVNEAPAVSNASFVAVSRTMPGTFLGKIAASDPDEFDFPSFAIVSGNEAGKFSIDANGRILSAGDWSAMDASYTLGIRVTDHGSLSADASVTIRVTPAPAGNTPGVVYRTLYEGISGSAVSDLTSNTAFPNSPTRLIRLDDFTDNIRGDNYGSVVRT